MKSAGIAELKARLSEYVRHVRQGESVLIMDRGTPVAHLVPYEKAMPLSVRKPPPGGPRPCEVPLPPPSGLELDVVELLLADRASGR